MIENGKHVIAPEHLEKLLIELLHEKQVFSDPTINLTGLEQNLKKVFKDLEQLKAKPEQIKSYPLEFNSFEVSIPKSSVDSFDLIIDAVTTNDKLISFSTHVPNQYVQALRDTPYTTYSNQYTLDTMKSYITMVDNKSSNEYIFFKLEFPREISSGIVTLISNDRYIDIKPIATNTSYSEDSTLHVSTEAPNLRQDIPSPELIVRSHTVKWLEGIKRSDYVLLELAKLTKDDTLYAVRDDDKTDNLTFKFTSKDEARRMIPKIYESIPKLWHLVTLEFEDTVTDIDGLFTNALDDDETEESKFNDTWPKLPNMFVTPRAIIGNGITSARGLYNEAKISKISPELFKGLPNLTNLDYAFEDCRDLVDDIPVNLLDTNTKLTTAKYMFYNSSAPNDPEFWKKKHFDIYPCFLEYISGTAYSKNPKATTTWPWMLPSDGNDYDFTFVTTKQFKDTYIDIISNSVSATRFPDRFVDFSNYSIEILEGNLDEMFYGTNVKKLPKFIKAVNAKTAKRFAKGETNLVNTIHSNTIFEKCPLLKDVTAAFSGCTGLTEGWDFSGASDTISIYDEVFKDCTGINSATLPQPWTYAGLDGYPLDIQGVNGYLNIPNLPDYVPKEWGGKGIGTTMNAIRSISPILEYCYENDDYITIDLKERQVGGILDIVMVNPESKTEMIDVEKRLKLRITTADDGRKFTVGLLSFCNHERLLQNDCVRVRYLEPRIPDSATQKIWSDFVYQTPIRKPNYTGDQNVASALEYVTWGEN